MEIHPPDDLNREAFRRAFELLARVELGHEMEWLGPTDTTGLKTRVELLALLLNVIPRSHLHRIGNVVMDWNTHFAGADRVSVRDLRERTRTILRQFSTNDTQEQTAASTMRRIEDLLAVEVGGLENGLPQSFSVSVRKNCALCLFTWERRLRKQQYLPNVIPGGSPTRLEDTYVELFARPQSAIVEFGVTPERISTRRTRNHLPPISLMAMVSRTLESCVVIGEPGSGKSTLIQWLAWATGQQRIRDFDHALVVRLRDYAARRSEAGHQTIVEFFLESLNTRLPGFRREAELLRYVAGKHKRLLLLLDGWDEVPVGERERVCNAIQQESPHFVVVVTSRAAGLPWQLFPNSHSDYYEIAGLAPLAVQVFVERQLRQLGAADHTQQIVGQIDSDPDLKGMSANPFLLGLIVRVLSQGTVGNRSLTLYELFQQIIDWVVEHHQRSVSASDRLQGEDLRALERLSYGLMFEQSPQYVFRRQDLDNALVHRSIDPLTQSRFINRLDPLFDNWSFLHATFEEYFAANYLASLDEQDLNAAWDHAFCSQSRLVALSFFAGYCGPKSAFSKTRVEYWLKHVDRFGVTLARLARLARAGHWSGSMSELCKRIEEGLWLRITTSSDWRCTRMFLEALALLNPTELVRLASTLGRHRDNRIQETICELVPAEMVKGTKLFDALPQNLRDAVNLRHRQATTVDDVDLLQSQIKDRSLSTSELLAVLKRAAGVVEPAIALALLERLLDERDEVLSVQITMSLSPIFGQLPAAKMLELLTHTDSLDATIKLLASATLGHADGDGQRLDPDGRDYLLRRLAVLPSDDDRVEHMLCALRGFPVRDGGMLIAQIAINPALTTRVRNAAINVLQTTSDLGAVQLVASSILTEPSDAVRPFLFQLAIQRDVVAPPDWLESQIAKETESLRRRTLVTVYIRMFSHASVEESRRFREFLNSLIQKALEVSTDDNDLLSFELADAIKTLGRPSGVFVTEEFRTLGIELFQRLIAGSGEVSVGQTHLAAALLRVNPGPQVVEVLEQTMTVLMKELNRTTDNRRRNEIEMPIMVVGEVLAGTAVGRLLSYAPHCEAVRLVLCRASLESGWMVFDDRVLDANGTELANLNLPVPTEGQLNTECIHTLLDRLDSESLKSAIQSRWIAICVCRACDVSASDKEIHQAIVRIQDGLEGEAASEAVATLYPTRVPQLNAWRQSVIRAVRKLKDIPMGLEYLRMQGLPKHR